MRLGVCYYPEHWSEDWWADDAAAMMAMGLSRVRIGEFAWSRIEPEPGRFDWGWLDRAVETLHAAGLGIMMGTPTATPPKWLVDSMPDMLAVDADGQPRKFGSRRHYCFSHRGYRAECARIVTALAERYGDHPAIVAWQTDNEYGCHDTAVSYSDAARHAFRDWLAAKHGDVGTLNAAWGNVFWSMEYRSFAEIGLPNLTVTEPNPAHVLDFRRFASDEVVSFNRLQGGILRAHSPGRDIVHNFMGFFTQFDHHAVARDLDIVTWDSYPLGFLDSFAMFSDDDKARYERQGHPDIAAFHHDLYRGMANNGRWAVMEQQPGPVNWARHNPAPLPGMVRLWTLEAMAHGAELVSYFRWRQAPFGQEQMHSGLHRPDRSEDVAAGEVREVANLLSPSASEVPLRALARTSGSVALAVARSGTSLALGEERTVALLFSYEAAWVIDTQPQGANFRYLDLVFAFYCALRRAGLNVDIVAPEAELSGYGFVVAPTLPTLSDATADRLATLGVPVLLGPRTGSKTAAFSIPEALPPGPLQRHLPLKIVRVESRRGDPRWIEHIESDLSPEHGCVWRAGSLRYLSQWPDAALLDTLVAEMAVEADLATLDLPRDVRVRRNGDTLYAFNYGPGPVTFAGQTLPPAGVALFPTGRSGDDDAG